jgi:hypothetical protein
MNAFWKAVWIQVVASLITGAIVACYLKRK